MMLSCLSVLFCGHSDSDPRICGSDAFECLDLRLPATLVCRGHLHIGILTNHSTNIKLVIKELVFIICYNSNVPRILLLQSVMKSGPCCCGRNREGNAWSFSLPPIIK